MNTKIQIINLQNNTVKNIFSHSYFSVPKQGAVQMLANGHFLITNSMEGYGFEINADTKKEFSIFNLSNTSISPKDSWIDRSPIFKINRYSFLELQDKN